MTQERSDAPKIPDWLPYLDPVYAPYVVMGAFALGCLLGAIMGELGAQDRVAALTAELALQPSAQLPSGYGFTLGVNAANDTLPPSFPMEGCNVSSTICTG